MIEYDGFSSDEEIREVLNKADGEHGGGPVLYIDWENGEPYANTSESNGIFLGVTGCGKTRRGTIPLTMSLIQGQESFISVDPKGDIFKYTHAFAKQAGYNVKVFNFRDVNKSDGFDLLGYPYEMYKSGDSSLQQFAIEILDDMARALYGHEFDNARVKDPFWDSSARTLFIANALLLFEHGEERHIHPRSLSHLALELFKKDLYISFSKRYIDAICEKFPDAPFTPLFNNARTAAHDTLASIQVSFFEPFNNFLKSPAVTDILSDSSFKLSDIDGKKKTAVYIILPDENTNYAALAAIVLSQFTSHLIRIAHTMYDDHLPRRMNVIIEELGGIGTSLPKMDLLMSAGRSRNLRTFFVIQSLSQLDTLYGPSKAETIISNADTLVAYRTNVPDTLELLSRKCGEYFDYDIDFPRRLVTPTQLGSLETGEALVMIGGKTKFVSQLPDFTELANMKRWHTPVHPVSRSEVKSDLLDLGAFLKAIREKEEEAIRKEAEKDGRSVDESPRHEPTNPFGFSSLTAHLPKPDSYVTSKKDSFLKDEIDDEDSDYYSDSHTSGKFTDDDPDPYADKDILGDSYDEYDDDDEDSYGYVDDEDPSDSYYSEEPSGYSAYDYFKGKSLSEIHEEMVKKREKEREELKKSIRRILYSEPNNLDKRKKNLKKDVKQAKKNAKKKARAKQRQAKIEKQRKAEIEAGRKEAAAMLAETIRQVRLKAMREHVAAEINQQVTAETKQMTEETKQMTTEAKQAATEPKKKKAACAASVAKTEKVARPRKAAKNEKASKTEKADKKKDNMENFKSPFPGAALPFFLLISDENGRIIPGFPDKDAEEKPKFCVWLDCRSMAKDNMRELMEESCRYSSNIRFNSEKKVIAVLFSKEEYAVYYKRAILKSYTNINRVELRPV
ncbi:MAG: type IV secretory system conjugative DNA transfer family protein [Clostridiales bacterium]|nr:type IV secretory system conjugative DNA transfer family protein [Clostridiales bacterium]